jgi:hypothetical protein
VRGNNRRSASYTPTTPPTSRLAYAGTLHFILVDVCVRESVSTTGGSGASGTGRSNATAAVATTAHTQATAEHDDAPRCHGITLQGNRDCALTCNAQGAERAKPALAMPLTHLGGNHCHKFDLCAKVAPRPPRAGLWQLPMARLFIPPVWLLLRGLRSTWLGKRAKTFFAIAIMCNMVTFVAESPPLNGCEIAARPAAIAAMVGSLPWPPDAPFCV